MHVLAIANLHIQLIYDIECREQLPSWFLLFGGKSVLPRHLVMMTQHKADPRRGKDYQRMSVIFHKTKKKATEQDQQPGSPNSMGHMIKVLEHIFPRSAQGLWTYFAPRGHFIPEHLADTKVRTDVTKIKGPYTVRVKFYSPSSAPFIRSLSICGVLEKTKVSIAAIAAIAYFALLNLYHFLLFDISKT